MIRCHKHNTPWGASMTVDEYLEFEENSPVRHEYVNGSIYAMSAGRSPGHRASTDRELAASVVHRSAGYGGVSVDRAIIGAAGADI
jgi:Uma2 family endonuclease